MKSQDLERIRFVTHHFQELQGLRYGVPLGLITLSLGGTTYFANRPFLLLRAAFLLGGIFLLFFSKPYYRRTFGEVERQPVHDATQPESLSIYSPAGSTPWPLKDQRVSLAVRYLLISMGLALTLLLILAKISPAVEIATDASLVQAPWLSSSVVIAGDGVGRESLSMLKVQTMYTLYGSLFLGVWFWRERRLSQSYYLICGALMLGFSALDASVGLIMAGAWSPRIVDAFFLPITQFWLAVLICGGAMILAGLLDHRQLVRALGQPLALRVEGLR